MMVGLTPPKMSISWWGSTPAPEAQGDGEDFAVPVFPLGLSFSCGPVLIHVFPDECAFLAEHRSIDPGFDPLEPLPIPEGKRTRRVIRYPSPNRLSALPVLPEVRLPSSMELLAFVPPSTARLQGSLNYVLFANGRARASMTLPISSPPRQAVGPYAQLGRRVRSISVRAVRFGFWPVFGSRAPTAVSAKRTTCLPCANSDVELSLWGVAQGVAHSSRSNATWNPLAASCREEV